MKHQKGNGKIAEKNPVRRVIVKENISYIDALQVAAETYPNLTMIRVHTRLCHRQVPATPYNGKVTHERIMKRIFLFQ